MARRRHAGTVASGEEEKNVVNIALVHDNRRAGPWRQREGQTVAEEGQAWRARLSLQ